jgi:hypothetical protein
VDVIKKRMCYDEDLCNEFGLTGDGPLTRFKDFIENFHIDGVESRASQQAELELQMDHVPQQQIRTLLNRGTYFFV